MGFRFVYVVLCYQVHSMSVEDLRLLGFRLVCLTGMYTRMEH